MKILLVRAFAFSLVITGVIASAQIVQNQPTAVAGVTMVNRMPPVPVCPPDDPNGCGLGQVGK